MRVQPRREADGFGAPNLGAEIDPRGVPHTLLTSSGSASKDSAAASGSHAYVHRKRTAHACGEGGTG
eukprot:3644551-Pleurochrysis_carterae.AAC.1